MNGRIMVESAAERGAHFTIYLPEAAGNSVETKGEDGRTLSGSAVEARIALIDDEPDVARVTSLILKRAGFSVTAFTDSQQALDLIRTDIHSYDVLLTDFVMPAPAGDEVVRTLRGFRSDLPVIIMSGQDTVPIEVAEGVEVMHKPLDEAELVNRITSLLAAGQTSA
jgi:DNA-binding response OmpR family regulator